jgi:hypothetical protein
MLSLSNIPNVRKLDQENSLWPLEQNARFQHRAFRHSKAISRLAPAGLLALSSAANSADSISNCAAAIDVFN